MNTEVKTSVILLAGGSGTRMNMQVPKQFLPLHGKPVALYSFELFLNMPQINEIIVVCRPEYRNLFSTPFQNKPIGFALPGERRQDSVLNGFNACSSSTHLICIHDSARPVIARDMVERVLEAGNKHSAATLGTPVKFTIKKINEEGFVAKTMDRSMIWEIQTPQVVHRDILLEGFEYAHTHNLTVTDDVSLAELVGCPIKLVKGTDSNIKITVQNDLTIAAHYLSPTFHA